MGWIMRHTGNYKISLSGQEEVLGLIQFLKYLIFVTRDLSWRGQRTNLGDMQLLAARCLCQPGGKGEVSARKR